MVDAADQPEPIEEFVAEEDAVTPLRRFAEAEEVLGDREAVVQKMNVEAEAARLFTVGRHVVEYRFRKADGTWCWVSDELRVLRDAAGEPLEVVGAWSDITSRKQLGEALVPGGRLAVISSRMGSIGLRSATSGWLYRASKAALNSVLKDASLALAGKAICATLHPGWVQTDMGGAGAELSVARSAADLRATVARLTPADNGGFFNHDGQPLAW